MKFDLIFYGIPVVFVLAALLGGMRAARGKKELQKGVWRARR